MSFYALRTTKITKSMVMFFYNYLFQITIATIVLLQFFVLDLQLNFQRLSEDDVYTQLERIAEMADDGADTARPVGVLTTADRTTWARAREQLLKGTCYKELISLFRCLLNYCLVNTFFKLCILVLIFI